MLMRARTRRLKIRRSVATDMISVRGAEGRIPMQSHNRRTGQPVHTKSTFVHWSTGSVRLLLVEGAAPSLSTTDCSRPRGSRTEHGFHPLPCEQQHRESDYDVDDLLGLFNALRSNGVGLLTTLTNIAMA